MLTSFMPLKPEGIGVLGFGEKLTGLVVTMVDFAHEVLVSIEVNLSRSFHVHTSEFSMLFAFWQRPLSTDEMTFHP